MNRAEQLDLPITDDQGNVLDKEGYIIREPIDKELSEIIERLKKKNPKESEEEIKRQARRVKANKR